MYGIGDDIQELADKAKRLESKLFDIKTLAQLLLDRPNDETVRNAVRIAIKNIEA